MKLKIIESSWSGLRQDYKPEEIEKEYDIKLNERYTIKSSKTKFFKDDQFVEEEREIFSFCIVEINDSSIRIKTYQPFSDNDDGTVNFYSDKRDFVITTQKPLKLTTLTKDSGDIFTLLLIK